MTVPKYKDCYIFGASSIGVAPFPEKETDTLIIAADGGLRHLIKAGLSPDIALGDFDSLGEIPKVSCELIRYPAEKDDTDMGIAIKTGLTRGCDRFFLLGGMGGERPDHTLANLQALVFTAKNGASAFLTDGKNCFTAITADKTLVFPENYRGGVSVFSAEGTAEGVTLKGLYYSLDNAALTGDFPLGVSNRITDESLRSCGNSPKKAEISVKKGSLIIYFELNGLAYSDYPTVTDLQK